MNDQSMLTDALTGLSTQWHFDVIFDFVFELGDRGVPMALVLFGVDELEAYASDRGDGGRSAVIEGFGKLLAAASRKMDLTARYGDDRFMCLLLACNLQGGMVFADRIRSEADGFTDATGLTVSAGVAAYTDDMGARDDLAAAVVGALDAAAAAGGDRVGLPQDATD